MSKPAYFKCRGCGKKHYFGILVAARPMTEVIHTCECGQKHSVINYMAKAIK